jgi:hypothetical protein
MARKVQSRASKTCVTRMAGSLFAWAGRRHSLSLLAALVLLLSAAVPFWHAGQRLQSWGAAFAEPQSRHDASAHFDCHHQSSSGSAQTDGANGPLQKRSCPLCKALLLFPACVTAPEVAFVPYVPQAGIALAAHEAESMERTGVGGFATPRASLPA